MKTLVLIRTYPQDEYIATLCANSFKSVMDCDIIYFGEPGEYRNIKPLIRPHCSNFGGAHNVLMCISGLRGIDVSGYDKVIFADSDITVHKNFLIHDFDFGGVRSQGNPRHYSGQMLIFSREIFEKVVNYAHYPELFQHFINEGRSIADDTIFSFIATDLTQNTKDFYGLNYWTHHKLHHLEKIDLSIAQGFQYKDDDGFVLPWFTKPALDFIKTLPLKQMDVFEYGSGSSSIWFAKHSKTVTAVDSNELYTNAVIDKCIELDITNCKSLYHHDPGKYINEVKNGKYDLIVIDGSYRDECIQPALERLKPGGYLLFDNYNQPSVHMVHPQLCEILEKMEHWLFQQPGHYDWQTLVAKK